MPAYGCAFFDDPGVPFGMFGRKGKIKTHMWCFGSG
jgi:hypothetical protein